MPGADGYQLCCADNAKFKKATKQLAKKTSLTVKKLKAGKEYFVKVRAYKVDSTGKKVYGKYSPVMKAEMK